MGSEFTDDPFVARPRRPKRAPEHRRESIRRQLSRIHSRVLTVASGSRDDFVDGAPLYDVASMAIICLSSLLERSEFAPWAALMSDNEVQGVRALGSIILSSRHAEINDDIFWNVVTVEVPEVVERLLKR
jgi:hypothetical protein